MISMMMSMILQPGRGSPDRENKGGEVHQHGEPSRDRLYRGFQCGNRRSEDISSSASSSANLRITVTFE